MDKKGCSKDYHDYVFQNGKLVGDFDNMYRFSDTVPWHQDTLSDSWLTELGLTLLKSKTPYSRVLEIGCGLGYISRRLKDIGFEVDAFDVSEVAIEKAAQLHKGINFFVKDIKSKDFELENQYDLVVVKDIFWYVFDHMPTVIRNIEKCLRNQGYLYICQSFPVLNRDFIGKRVISDPDRLVNYFSEYLPIYIMKLDRYQVDDGPVLYYMGMKK